MNSISTHVLDTARGIPAARVPVVLERLAKDGSWSLCGKGETDEDGRQRALLDTASFSPDTYRLRFDTSAYFEAQRVSCFFPEVTIVFSVTDTSRHYHVPLLLAPFGYSTYRGS